jgi:hypothetical protein
VTARTSVQLGEQLVRERIVSDALRRNAIRHIEMPQGIGQDRSESLNDAQQSPNPGRNRSWP